MCRSIFFKIASFDTEYNVIAGELKRDRTTLFRYRKTFEYDMIDPNYRNLYFDIERSFYSKKNILTS